MNEFILEETYWPKSLGDSQREILRSILFQLHQNADLIGVAARGSFISGYMDEFSDLDIIVIVEQSAWIKVFESRHKIAKSIGSLLLSFTGEHVGESNLLICLYGPSLVHVDLKFITIDQIDSCDSNPVLLWDHDNRLHSAISDCKLNYSQLDWQWIEDRFWHWIQYASAKIGRGEFFEAINVLNTLRGRVLGPLALNEAHSLPYGVKKIEQIAPERAKQMQLIIAKYNKVDIVRALRAAIDMYRSFRDGAPENLELRSQAELIVEKYFEDIANRVEK